MCSFVEAYIFDIMSNNILFLLFSTTATIGVYAFVII